MGRPKAVEGSDTRARILTAAAEAFAAEGYDAKLAAIAAKVGVRRPSLLYYFETKHALYCAVVRETFVGLSAAVTAPLNDERDLATRLEAIVAGFEGYFAAHPDAAKLILREVLDDRGPGRDLLLELGVPLLDTVEAFAAGPGREHLRGGVPLRAGLMSLVGAALVRAAAGEALVQPFFGPSALAEVFRTAYLREVP